MAVQIGLLKLRNPVILASGLVGSTPEELKRAYDMGAGAVVTKSVTLEPREGHPEPNFVPSKTGGWLNAIGLRNDGAVEFAGRLGKPGYPVIVSLAGSDPAEFVAMIRMFDGVIAFELNLSCPNASGLGCDVGTNPKLVAEIVRAAKSATTLPIFVKIAYDMSESAAAAIEAGADGITAINTVPAMAIDIETGQSKLSTDGGGLSGPPIQDIALRTVSQMIHQHNVPVMGCGGISTWQDAALFLQAGAFAVQVGSAAMERLAVIGEIVDGLASWTPKHT